MYIYDMSIFSNHLVLTILAGFLGTGISAQIPQRVATKEHVFQHEEQQATQNQIMLVNEQFNVLYFIYSDLSGSKLICSDFKSNILYRGPIDKDLSSIWYNTKAKKLQGIRKNDAGRFEISINEKGIPSGTKYINEQGKPADTNNVHYVNMNDSLLAGFNNSEICITGIESENLKNRIPIPAIPGAIENINRRIIAYTGIRDYEFAFFDYFEGKIYYTDLNGKFTGTTLLPNDATESAVSGMAYFNGQIWLFEPEKNQWQAYRIITQ